MEELQYKYIFGPVRSRRLGISLGIDLMPHKTCTLDCAYCECGKTTKLTMKRKAYVPTEAVLAELAAYLGSRPELDYITFSGSGEPTLHSGIGEIIRFIKSEYPMYKVALLTNGTLFHLPAVRDEVSCADLIVSSVDAAEKESFDTINKPHPKLRLEEMLEGLRLLRERYPGQLWIEFFVVPGINDDDAELGKVGAIAKSVSADRIQINTLDRPGTDDWVAPAGKEALARIAARLSDAEAVGPAAASRRERITGKVAPRILSTVRRRPCTIEDLAQSIGIRSAEVEACMATLLEEGRVVKKEMARGVFYMIE